MLPVLYPMNKSQPITTVLASVEGHAYVGVTRSDISLVALRERPSIASSPKRLFALRRQCGRICLGKKKINLSEVFAGQNVGIKEEEDNIWLVSFMQYDIGYFDLEACRVEPLENPFGPKVYHVSGINRYLCSRNGPLGPRFG